MTNKMTKEEMFAQMSECDSVMKSCWEMISNQAHADITFNERIAQLQYAAQFNGARIQFERMCKIWEMEPKAEDGE